MRTDDIAPTLEQLFAELTEGVPAGGGAFVLNSGDTGLLASLDLLSAADASRSVHEGATIAAHTQHVRYALSLMNAWAEEGGDPFSSARWDEAWKIREVDDAQWDGIRGGLRHEVRRWRQALRTPREVQAIEIAGMVGSIAHIAYHLGAMRQIAKEMRGPKAGTFTPASAGTRPA
jgi:hypothetical protein